MTTYVIDKTTNTIKINLLKQQILTSRYHLNDTIAQYGKVAIKFNNVKRLLLKLKHQLRIFMILTKYIYKYLQGM